MAGNVNFGPGILLSKFCQEMLGKRLDLYKNLKDFWKLEVFARNWKFSLVFLVNFPGIS